MIADSNHAEQNAQHNQRWNILRLTVDRAESHRGQHNRRPGALHDHAQRILQQAAKEQLFRHSGDADRQNRHQRELLV